MRRINAIKQGIVSLWWVALSRQQQPDNCERPRGRIERSRGRVERPREGFSFTLNNQKRF